MGWGLAQLDARLRRHLVHVATGGLPHLVVIGCIMCLCYVSCCYWLVVVVVVAVVVVVVVVLVLVLVLVVVVVVVVVVGCYYQLEASRTSCRFNNYLHK